MRIPRATYRLQFNRDFGYPDAAALVPYLSDLGVDTLYASPLTRARAGSTHGYDVVDPNALNPEIGTREDFDRMVRDLHDRGMGILLDIVPNHMGIGSENAWWLDLLENGPASAYARFFDVDWSRGGYLSGKVLLPVLGDHYRAILERGQLELVFDADGGSLSVNYYEHRFPLDPKTYPMVFEESPEDETGELDLLMEAFRGLPGREEGEERDTAPLKERLAGLHARSPEAARAVKTGIRRVNEQPDALHRILEAQAYRPAFWRVAGDEINYRRFFAVNDLAGVRVEDEGVFEATHRLILDLVSGGSVAGLRIDHPDGLLDPAAYLRRLQGAAREPVYVLVEKILAHDERLPEDWPVSGTTGYEFANLATGLFVDPAGEAGLDEAYGEFTGKSLDYGEIVYNRKKLVMRTDLASELDALSLLLLRLSEHGRSHDFTRNQLRDALSEVVARFPVYRTYVTAGSVTESDRLRVEAAVSLARAVGTAAEGTVYDFVRDALLLELDGPEGYLDAVARFAAKFQQYTGPVMAKGVEDSALYFYDRLVSLNEVGGEPDRFGVSVDGFHESNLERAVRWPHSMLSSTTHDTKRGEDVRARISVLSEIPSEWRERLARWNSLENRRERGKATSPDRNVEYLLYQTLIGAWPPGETDEEGLREFRDRIQAYMGKAVREAQAHTSWTDPDEDYEAGISRFVDALLSPESSFLPEFLPFWRRVARLGALNSLSQTLLKLTAPGVPDIYQGNELWDFSLVDPDNRRPVDYRLREGLLAGLKDMDPSSAPHLLEHGVWQDGRPKLYLTWKALGLRRARPDLFGSGEYMPLGVSGERAGHLVAFARRRGEQVAITAVPRLCANLMGDEGPLLPTPERWSDTTVVLPEGLAGTSYLNVLTGKEEKLEMRDEGASLPVADLLRAFPVALLVAGDDIREARLDSGGYWRSGS